jgi:hypothetical protein
MTVYVAHNRTNAVERIHSRMKGTVDLDYETGWEDAFELGRLGQQYGILVQFRTIEHVAVRSWEALVRGLRAPKLTFRQRHLYCMFDLTALPEASLCELEARAIQHGDYVLAGHLLKEPTLIWEWPDDPAEFATNRRLTICRSPCDSGSVERDHPF